MLHRDRRNSVDKGQVLPHRSICYRHTVAQGCHRGSVFMWSLVLPPSRSIRRVLHHRRQGCQTSSHRVTTSYHDIRHSAGMFTQHCASLGPKSQSRTQRSPTVHPWFSVRVAQTCLPLPHSGHFCTPANAAARTRHRNTHTHTHLSTFPLVSSLCALVPHRHKANPSALTHTQK